MKNQYTLKHFFSYLALSLFLLSGATLDAQTQQYLHFDRVDDFIEVPEASQYIANASGVTMAGWFYCDELAYGQGMMGFRNGGSGDGEMYMIQLNNGVLECRYITTSGFNEFVSPAFTVIPETWQHYAWVYDGSKVILYVDGEEVGSSNVTGGAPITSMDTPFAIGQLISPWDFPYGGRVDEVTVWSKALSQNEIQSMIDNELNGDEANLELYYKFNQGVPGEDNTSINKLISEVGDGDRYGLLQNFALMGEESNFGGELDNSFQAITFPQISDKLVSNDPFDIVASASSGLEVSFSIVSGPATVDGNTITLTGEVGEVIVRASQAGDGTYEAAEDIENSFQVLDPNTFVPQTEVRSPVAGSDVWVPELGPIQLACISNIGSPDLFSVDNVVFEIDGTTIDAKDWNNEHYTGWWTPPAYGDYTMKIIATNNYGGASTETVNFSVVDEMSDVSANAGSQIHLDVNTGVEVVSIELPSYMGAFDEIIGNLTIECPNGGCDPWDRISGVEVKGHNGEWYEIIRYITPYGLACNHSVDLTDFMSALQGKIDFRFYLGTQGNGFLYTLDLDYRGGTPAYKYSTIGKLWNATYDFGNMANLQPCEVLNAEYSDNVEASTIKMVSTGHGWGENNTGNAAEFHEDTHHVWVNGEETFAQHNWNDCDPNPDGCNDQFGTWYFDRAGWCPGSIAPWFDFDMTPFINSGTTELKYIFDEDYQDLCNENNPNCTSGVTCQNCNDGFNPHLIVASFLINKANAPLENSGVVNTEDPIQVDFQVFPNPSNGVVTVEFDESIQQNEVRVLNNLGQVVYLVNDRASTNVRVLNLEHLPAGIYFIEVRTDNEKGLRKLILE